VANIASAKKRARQNEKRRKQNTSQRSMLRTHHRNVLAAIQSGNRETAIDVFKTAVPVIDRMAYKKIIHKNKAARHKRQLNALLRGL